MRESHMTSVLYAFMQDLQPVQAEHFATSSAGCMANQHNRICVL